jgi:uncharacterized protein (DUF2141 family)
MKKSQIVILAGLLALAGAGAYAVGGRAPLASGTATLHVSLGGVAGEKGNLMGAICNKESFLKHCQYFAVTPATVHELDFAGVAPGTYAVMVYHDENDNGTLDRAANGMPLEGYGFSRNARGHWGPPSFEDAGFDIKPGANDIALDMVY